MIKLKDMKQDFGNKIKFARIKLGLTQSQLAQKLNISSSAIGMYEQGRRIPDYITLIKLCDTLNILIYDIFNEYKVFNVDILLNYVINYLNSDKPAVWRGNILDKQKKYGISYVLRLLLNER